MSEYVLQNNDKDLSVLSPVELSLTNFDNLVCFDCETRKTPLWRRGLKGEYLCNACGLYWKVHGTHRPLSLKSSIIKHRNRQRKDAQPTSKKSHSASIKRSISSSQPKGFTRKAMVVSPKSPSSLSSSSSSSLSSSSSSLPLSPRLSESNHILSSSPELSTKKIRRVSMNSPEPLQSKVALSSTSTAVSASLDNLQSKIALPRSASPAALISELNTVHHHGLRIKLGDFVIIRNEDDPQSSLYGCIRKFMVSKGQTFFFVTWLLPRPGIVIDWRECSPADFIWGPEEALPKAISLIVRLLPLVVDLSSDRESSAESTSSDEERNNLCERSFFATTLKPVLPSFRTGFKFVDAETTLQRTRSSTASNESSFSANDISAATMLFDLSIHRTPNQQNVIF